MAQTGQTRKQEAVIAALLSARTLQDAAQTAGISVRTLRRWLENDDFREKYRRAKSELVGFATGRLKGAMAKAVAVLEDVAETKDSPPAARVSASRAIVELALHSHEVEAMEDRIAELERRLNEEQA